jgi:hypothetical protein
MKKTFVILLLLSILVLSACTATISESAMETAVSQVILTSAATSPAQDEPEAGSGDQQPAGPSNEELEAAQSALEQANLQLTEQAAQIEALEAELDALYPLLTPTVTSTPFDTPTPLPTATATPRPTATVFTLPYYQKYVTPIDSAPLFTYDKKNDAGFPIMFKTSPVQKIPNGEVVIVDVNRVRADGGGYYYLIVGPKYTNYYVLITDVKEYKE